MSATGAGREAPMGDRWGWCTNTNHGPHRHKVTVEIEYTGDARRGGVVIEDALDLLMDRLVAHPAISDPSIAARK